MPTEASQRVQRALATFQMFPQVFDGVDFHRHVLVASVPHFYLLDDVVEKFGLHVSEAELVVGFAVHTSGHVSALDFVVLNETSIAHYFRAVLALFGVHWHVEADDALYHVLDFVIVDPVCWVGLYDLRRVN